MKLSTSLGRQVARPTVTGIVEQARDTQRAVRELAARAGELTGAVIRRGLLRITDGGGLVVDGTFYQSSVGVNGDTFGQFRWGALPDDDLYNRPDGQRQQGFLAYRDDGTLALAIGELRANDGQYEQAILWFDRAGNIIVSEDTNSGRGLARPHLGQFAGNGDTNIGRWPSTTGTTWTAIWSQFFEIQNPKLSWNAQFYVPAGCVGQFRLSYGSTVIGTSAQVNGGSTGTFSQWYGARVTLPGLVGDEQTLTLEGLVVAGTGEIMHNWLQVKGDQS